MKARWSRQHEQAFATATSPEAAEFCSAIRPLLDRLLVEGGSCEEFVAAAARVASDCRSDQRGERT
jgi:hypothetical protein